MAEKKEFLQGKKPVTFVDLFAGAGGRGERGNEERLQPRRGAGGMGFDIRLLVLLGCTKM